MRKGFRIFHSALLFCLLLCFCASASAAHIAVKAGSRGEAVKVVQQLLIEQHYLHDVVDGVCGPLTVAAIKNFQKEKGLEMDGVCGVITFKALNHGKEYVPSPAAIKEEQEAEMRRQKRAAQMASRYEHFKSRGRMMYVTATAYSAYDPGNCNRTASGTQVRHGVIAVDPSVIPLGTHVYIPNYGEAIAEDIGSAIRGSAIDVAFDSHEEAILFGRQNLTIYVMD